MFHELLQTTGRLKHPVVSDDFKRVEAHDCPMSTWPMASRSLVQWRPTWTP
jgi:hypothetical protein